ncbi:hypothetical protein B484DRAFT_441462 [Ochromonadaceae sp. CCMP2298]|nr:hypothetical protein B484DRAFT_441462 [Ochromonadaceae sp. CCMP2298]
MNATGVGMGGGMGSGMGGLGGEGAGVGYRDVGYGGNSLSLSEGEKRVLGVLPLRPHPVYLLFAAPPATASLAYAAFSQEQGDYPDLARASFFLALTAFILVSPNLLCLGTKPTLSVNMYQTHFMPLLPRHSPYSSH